MDETETLAKQFLAGLGLGVPVFEPDGNVPPDFLLEGRIAVEVRRLNQNDHRLAGARGLEEDQIPMLHRIRKLLESLGPPRHGRSWFVSYTLTRPLEDWRTLEPQVRGALEAFVPQSVDRTGRVELGSPLQISVHPASKPHQEMFVLGGYTDHDSGGWLLAELERNLGICIEEKTRKVAPFRAKYPIWWLVFVNHVGPQLSAFDRELFNERVHVGHEWDRVVLIDRFDPSQALDIPSSS
jgi:hypothetical protein